MLKAGSIHEVVTASFAKVLYIWGRLYQNALTASCSAKFFDFG
jgi:hypothetical protein